MNIQCIQSLKRKYADALSYFIVTGVEGLSEDQVIAHIKQQHKVGNEWWNNQLEDIKQLANGVGYSYLIRQPYTD